MFEILQFLTTTGAWMSVSAIAIVLYFAWFGTPWNGLRIKWVCMFCGKFNETNLFKAFFNICDHDGVS